MVNNLQGLALDGDGRAFPINGRRPPVPEPPAGVWAVVEYPVPEVDPPGRDLQIVYRSDHRPTDCPTNETHTSAERWYRYEPENPAPGCPESWRDILSGSSRVYQLQEMTRRRPYRIDRDTALLRKAGIVLRRTAVAMGVLTVLAVAMSVYYGEPAVNTLVRAGSPAVFTPALAYASRWALRRVAMLERIAQEREQRLSRRSW